MTNDRAAFVAVETFIDANLESDKSGYVPTGLFVIGSNLTLAKSWEFAYGAQIQPANGVTVTFNGPFAAGIYQVFDTSAGGTIAFGINSIDGTSPQWWGAVANAIPSSANHAAIRAAIVAAQGAGVPTRVPSGRIDLTLEVTPPNLNSTCIFGLGLRLSELRQTTSTEDVLVLGLKADPHNGYVVRDLHLVGGQVCLRMDGIFRSLVQNVHIELGSVAGMRLSDSNLFVIRDTHIDGSYDGFYFVQTGLSGLNAFEISALTIENCTRYAMYLDNGAFGGKIQLWAQSCKGGGLRTGLDIWDVEVHGSYFEENWDAAAPTVLTEDIYVGVESYCGMDIHGSYFNGAVIAEAVNYVPIRVKYGDRLIVRNNTTYFGSKFVEFVAGGAVPRSSFGPNNFGPSFVLTNPKTVYANVPVSFVDGGSQIIEPRVVPYQPGNYSPLFGSWTASLGAGSTFAIEATNKWRGKDVWKLLRSGTNVSEIYVEIVVGAVKNAEMRNKYVTFGVPIYNEGSVTPANITQIMSPNGTGAANASTTHSQALSEGWVVHYVTGFVPSDATLITLVLTNASASGVFFLGIPYFYVGVCPLQEAD